MADSNLLEQKLQDIVTSAGGDAGVKPPNDCRDKLGWYLDLIGELLRTGGGGSGGGGVTTHNLLSGRDEGNQHPISAITGLQNALTEASQNNENLRQKLHILVTRNKTLPWFPGSFYQQWNSLEEIPDSFTVACGSMATSIVTGDMVQVMWALGMPFEEMAGTVYTVTDIFYDDGPNMYPTRCTLEKRGRVVMPQGDGEGGEGESLYLHLYEITNDQSQYLTYLRIIVLDKRDTIPVSMIRDLAPLNIVSVTGFANCNYNSLPGNQFPGPTMVRVHKLLPFDAFVYGEPLNYAFNATNFSAYRALWKMALNEYNSVNYYGATRLM